MKGVKGYSIVRDLEYVDLILSFDLDFMHAFCINTGQRLLKIWFSSEFSNHPRSLFQHLNQLETTYAKFKMPHFMQRIPSKLANYQDWKAAEVRYRFCICCNSV